MLLELKSEKDMLPDKAPKRPVIFTFKTTQKKRFKNNVWQQCIESGIIVLSFS